MTSNTNLEANKAFKPNKGFYKHYNKKGHIKLKCFIKYFKLRKPYNKNNKNKDKRNKDNSESFNNKDIKNEFNKVIISALISNTIKGDLNYKLVLNSGATKHYTTIKEWLIDYKLVNNRFISIVNSIKMLIKGVSNIPIIIKGINITIKDVYYIPSLKTTLISFKELTNKGWTILFKDNIAEISNIKYNINFIIKWDYNAYYLNVIINYNILKLVIYKAFSININKLDLIYKRLNHLNKDYLIKTIKCIKGLNSLKEKEEELNLNNCNLCYNGKFIKVRSKEPFKSTSNLIYLNINIRGSFKTSGLKGKRYFLTITNRGNRTI
jgi:hypothetical protein